MSVQELANRKYNNEVDSTNPLCKQIVDVDCVYEQGKFILKNLPASLPGLFTIRFTAPADYTQADVVVIKDKELPVRTPGMTSASSGIFAGGAVIHCDIDLDREIAFFWQGAGGGIGGTLPNHSYDEQFAGFYSLDNKKVYVKTIELGNWGNGTYVLRRVPHGVQNLNEVVYFHLWSYSDVHCWAGNFTHGDNLCTCFYDKRGGVFTLQNQGWNYSHVKIRIIVYYTCTDR